MTAFAPYAFSLRRRLLILLTGLALGGCGQMGPLYLPEDGNTVPAAEEPAKEEPAEVAPPKNHKN